MGRCTDSAAEQSDSERASAWHRCREQEHRSESDLERADVLEEVLVSRFEPSDAFIE